tara:strand:- start:81 stop:389 length:309 start_codon:yes stop_codon:yes gene_type:complete
MIRQEKTVCVKDIETLISQSIESDSHCQQFTVHGVKQLANLVSSRAVLDDGRDLTFESVEAIFLDVIEKLWIIKGDTAFTRMGYTKESRDFMESLQSCLEDH